MRLRRYQPCHRTVWARSDFSVLWPKEANAPPSRNSGVFLSPVSRVIYYP